jgi:hypothetical protein
MPRLVTADTVVDISSEISEMQARGFKAWNGSNPTQAITPTTQNEVAVKVPLPLGQYLITNAIVNISTAGSTLTAGQNLLTLYAQDGTLVGQVPDQSAVWTTGGTYLTAFTGGPFTLTGGQGRYCWVGVLSNGTTPATFRAINSSVVTATLAGSGAGALTGANLYWGRIGATVTAPASFTPSSLVSTNAGPIWIGLS